MDAGAPFLDKLLAAGLLIETGVDGLYGRGGGFEAVTTAFDAMVSRYGEDDGAERVSFPPGMSRAVFERSGYLKSFPQLAGTVHSFCGDDEAHAGLLAALAGGEDWLVDQAPTDVVLTPAACYPLYPMIAARGPLPAAGALFELQSYCFRHEPARDPARMQMFRMREFVRAGDPDQVLEFRETWLERGREMMAALDLPAMLDVASDPFFGRGGRLLKANQRDQRLKFEMLVPITRSDQPTACLSFNYHQDHFGQTFGLVDAVGATAHTACVGFGLERMTLALFRHHGLDPETWPEGVRRALWP